MEQGNQDAQKIKDGGSFDCEISFLVTASVRVAALLRISALSRQVMLAL